MYSTCTYIYSALALCKSLLVKNKVHVEPTGNPTNTESQVFHNMYSLYTVLSREPLAFSAHWLLWYVTQVTVSTGTLIIYHFVDP